MEFITGGVHGNEWIPPEALIYFIKSLCDAFKNNKDLVIGKNTYPKETINKILERIEFYIYPLVNPDGRYQSQTRTNSDSMIGRKNRRPISKKYFGVDINRNFDFLWDYEKYFSRKAETYNLSKNISSDNYILVLILFQNLKPET
ncbi:MAG: hypothetical protein IPP52_08285 [Ignavibacteria bacterium]|nr:hypothetical protein [Ignavibacteria bacterium]